MNFNKYQKEFNDKKRLSQRVYRIKRSLEDNAIPLRKLQKKKGLAALQIRQRGKNIRPSNKFLFSDTLPSRSRRIQDRINNSKFLQLIYNLKNPTATNEQSELVT